MWSIAAIPNMPASCRSISGIHLIRQGHGRSGPNPEYVLATVAELERLGCRDAELHALAERLKGAHDANLAARGDGV